MNIIETKWSWRGGEPLRRNLTNYIALHHAAAKTCTADQIDEWHKANGWSGIGYHFFVRKDGSIYRGRPLDSIGAHVQGMNDCSVGICAEGDYDVEEEMPAAQKSAIKALLRYLKDIYPSAKIVGHRDIGDSDCPGRYYPVFEMQYYYKDEEEIDMEQINELKLIIAGLNAVVAAQAAKYDGIIDVMGEEIDALKTKEVPMIYDYADKNMPEWAVPTVQRLMGNDVIRGDETGRLGLTYDMLRMLVMLDRANVFGS